jgi:type III secretion system (T3SS) SseB-like protein
MELGGHIAAVRAGAGDPAGMVGELRRTAVLVPVTAGRFMSAVHDGVRWIYAFSDEAALARFASARGSAEGPQQEWEYASVLGARLLDVVLPALEGPAGVAVNVADEGGSMLFPPVGGIVPDGVAVDVAVDVGEAGR